MASAEPVTVCIPAWNAAPFIDATLTHARRQSYPAVEIVVSVDLSDDDTAERCRRAAAADPRVRVVESDARLGWAANTNRAIAHAETDLYAIYFHDDQAEPDWIARLASALEERPDAGSAFCAVAVDDRVTRGESIEGGALDRVMRRLLGPARGSPLRALTRRSRMDVDLRLPEGSPLGFHVQHAYLLDMAASAPSIYVDAPLYRRWGLRPGGVTHGWKSLPPDVVAGDLRLTAAQMLDTVDRTFADPLERDLAACAAGLSLELALRKAERADPRTRSIDMSEISERFAETRARVDVDACAEPWRTWMAAGSREIAAATRALEARRRSTGT